MSDEHVSGADTGAADQNTDLQSQDVQARLTQTEQENARLRSELEALQPYVQFGSDDVGTEADADPVQKLQAEVDAARNEVRQTKAELVTENFFSQNEDLRQYEDIVLTKFQKTDAKKSIKDRLADAAQQTRDLLKGEREAAIAAQKQASEAKTKAEAATGGVMEGGATAPASSDQEDSGWESNDDYAAQRRREHDETFAAGTT